MRRAWAAAVLASALACIAAAAQTLVPYDAAVLVSASLAPPSPDAAWQPVALPDDSAYSRPGRDRTQAWYRIGFDAADAVAAPEAWAAYLPYLYDGGSVWLNGALLTHMPENTVALRARSYRPYMIPFPSALLHAGRNELMVRVAPSPTYPVRFAHVEVGPQARVVSLYDRRLFWMRAVPQITVLFSLGVAGFVLFIWWRRRSEVLYGLFGLAAALWGIRTLNFIIDALPLWEWQWWRIAYHCATGGFVVAMALFTLRFAGLRRPRLERALLAYWAIGPLWFALQGFAAEPLVARVWLGGMIPVGVAIIALSFWAVVRQRTLLSAVMPAAMAFAVLVGIHDYLINWDSGVIGRFFPDWAGHRIYLLHYGSIMLLLAMGGVLTARFVQTLGSLEELNRSLETRVADRERALAANYARVAALEREHAAAEERQLIMRDLHDGLGSQLFTSLSRVERGDMDGDQIAAALRACIADMRLALDALASEEHDLGTALGNFMFRWEAQLIEAGVRSSWAIDVPDGASTLSPHAALQLLRVAQEALTNVLRHARATRVQVRLHRQDGMLALEVEDDGCGLDGSASPPGRGMGNMRSRAQRLGGLLDFRSGASGTCIVLRLPIAA
ncbi:Sensor protein VraS [Variovorax sp. SRS16]|uniref:sensor histidine kinase n=1 Tax=Variovorax sp. SRS16 TaxID=282217 RepID=UPI00131914EC|nr:ATP-binding protein [Variovorax sp. SRS16]VTU32496.1 Sensor protein VraS [Variovorax sp. SRS16]